MPEIAKPTNIQERLQHLSRERNAIKQKINDLNGQVWMIERDVIQLLINDGSTHCLTINWRNVRLQYDW